MGSSAPPGMAPLANGESCGGYSTAGVDREDEDEGFGRKRGEASRDGGSEGTGGSVRKSTVSGAIGHDVSRGLTIVDTRRLFATGGGCELCESAVASAEDGLSPRFCSCLRVGHGRDWREVTAQFIRLNFRASAWKEHDADGDGVIEGAQGR